MIFFFIYNLIRRTKLSNSPYKIAIEFKKIQNYIRLQTINKLKITNNINLIYNKISNLLAMK